MHHEVTKAQRGTKKRFLCPSGPRAFVVNAP
jgi:hypothetical protein